ncbi:MAG: nitrite reductase (NAD(P)H) small subunit [Gammaproteobacteria bacterium]|nr:MAG: nitrite reductase (NAD(P)H) small subunit [Gammaproteobacteria bacterium]
MSAPQAAAPGLRWVEAGPVEAVPRLGARVLETPLGPVAVFRTAEDELYALLDRCPHRGGPLSQGLVYGRRVACPLHGWAIELADGRAAPPDQGCTPSFPVRVEEGRILVGLPPGEGRAEGA